MTNLSRSQREAKKLARANGISYQKALQALRARQASTTAPDSPRRRVRFRQAPQSDTPQQSLLETTDWLMVAFLKQGLYRWAELNEADDSDELFDVVYEGLACALDAEQDWHRAQPYVTDYYGCTFLSDDDLLAGLTGPYMPGRTPPELTKQEWEQQVAAELADGPWPGLGRGAHEDGAPYADDDPYLSWDWHLHAAYNQMLHRTLEAIDDGAYPYQDAVLRATVSGLIDHFERAQDWHRSHPLVPNYYGCTFVPDDELPTFFNTYESPEDGLPPKPSLQTLQRHNLV